jgi:hypothetical protein
VPAASEIVAFLGGPVVAAAIGVALGACLLAMTAAGVRSFTPDTLEIGAMRAVAMLVLGLALGFLGLLLYYLFVRPGLVAFGLGLAAGFAVPATVALFRASGVTKPSTTRR